MKSPRLNAESQALNRRNGSYPKTVTSSMGEIELNIPRDRKGEYEPELIPKGSHDVSALEEKVLSLYARAQATETYPMWSMISTASSSVMRRSPISWIAFNRESLSGRQKAGKGVSICLHGRSDGEHESDKKSGKYAVYSIIASTVRAGRTALASGSAKMRGHTSGSVYLK